MRWFLNSAVLLILPPLLWPQSQPPASETKKPDLQAAPVPDAKTSNAPGNNAATAPKPGDSTLLETIKAPKPVYPFEARSEQLQGQVWVKLLISETGDVESVDVISGNPILAKAAVEAFKKWKFKPYIRSGQAVKASVKLPMDFAFRDKVTDTPVPANPDVTGAEKRVVVSPGVVKGLKIHDVLPIYPEGARQARIQGTVLLRAVIGEDGRIARLEVISGPKPLIQAAIGAVQQWRYKPYIQNNEPVEVDTQITVNFSLGGHR